MPLFGKKEGISREEFINLQIPPDVLTVLQTVLQQEIRDHPNDVWDEEGKRESLKLIFLILDEFLRDTYLLNLSTDALRQQYKQLFENIARGKKPPTELHQFLNNHIPYFSQLMTRTFQEFINGAYLDYDVQRRGDRMVIVKR